MNPIYHLARAASLAGNHYFALELIQPSVDSINPSALTSPLDHIKYQVQLDINAFNKDRENRPLFKHDCLNSCVFLGTFDYEDLYIHPTHPVTLISRLSSEPSDYRSNTDSTEPHLAEAQTRAIALGLL